MIQGLTVIAETSKLDSARVRAFELLGNYLSLWQDYVNVNNLTAKVVFLHAGTRSRTAGMKLTGNLPQPASVRRLRERDPQWLTHEPELADAVGDGQGISYTQW